LTKISIFDKNCHFSRKFQYLTKNYAVLQRNNGGGFTALAVDDILYDPAGNLGTSAISNGQLWY